MREFIKNIETYGTLEIKSNKLKIEDVRAEYKTDYYKTSSVHGIFYLKSLSASFVNNFRENKDFIYITLDYETISGYIYNVTPVNYKKYHWALYFRIVDIFSWVRYNSKTPKQLKIDFRIPYVKVFNRHLYKSNDVRKNLILKFTSKPIKVLVEGSHFVFNEQISIIKNNYPDDIFSRDIKPSVEIKLGNNYNLLGIVKKHKLYLDNIMLIVSFLVCNSMRSFGYTCNIYDGDNDIVQTITYNDFDIVSGEEFIEERIDGKFKEKFTGSNIGKLVRSYIKVQTPKLTRIIHSFLTAHELTIIEVRFLSSFFVLEGICKIISQKRGIKLKNYDRQTQSKTEEIIKIVCSKLGIDLNKIVFTSNTKKNKFKWLISEYRNSLVHSNQLNINFDIMHRETERILMLSRKLILNYLHKPLTDFPFHKQSRNILR